MSIVIKSGSNEMSVDPGSKAFRALLVREDGSEQFPPVAGVYFAPISIPSMPASGNLWTMRLDSAATVSAYIRALHFRMAFYGTTAVGSNSMVFLRRFATTASGGTVLTPIKARAAYPSSQMQSVRVTTGSSLGGVTITGYLALALNLIHHQQAHEELAIDFCDFQDPLMKPKLAPGEGFVLALNGAAVSAGLSGYVEWEER